MMNNLLQLCISLIPAFIFGLVLGMAFFLIMWLTVRRGVISDHPVKWFLGGFLLRMSIAVAGFFIIAKGGWLTLIICLLGFVFAREIVRRLVVSMEVSSTNIINSELK